MTAYSSEQAVREDLIETDGVVDPLLDGQRCHLLVALLGSGPQHAPDLPNASGETSDAEPETTTVQGGGDDDATDAPPDSGADPENPPPRAIADDDAFHLLQNARRRAVLRHLLAHPGQKRFRMGDLAKEIAAWEHDTTVRGLAAQQRQRVYIALYQSHLPKLDDHGVITYDQSRGVIEPTPLLAVFEPFLESGLHADTQTLTLDGGAVTPTESGTGGGLGLVAGLSSLFTR